MRDIFGDYQRQLFLMDHAGLPLKTVLEQLDFLGGEVVPVLRKELAQNRPENVPDAPTHAARVRRLRRRTVTPGDAARQPRRQPVRPSPYQDARPRRCRVRSAGRRDERASHRRRLGGPVEPSSTRMLADRLAAATVARLGRRRASRHPSTRSNCAISRTTSRTTCSPASRRPRWSRRSTRSSRPTR
jgi:hypothetical protein